jgi:hypothetical protein
LHLHFREFPLYFLQSIEEGFGFLSVKLEGSSGFNALTGFSVGDYGGEWLIAVGGTSTPVQQIFERYLALVHKQFYE